jgi:hypothetical protein
MVGYVRGRELTAVDGFVQEVAVGGSRL